MEGGIVYGLIGVWPPFSSAAATVTGFSVLPGANTFVTLMLGVVTGLNGGYCAIARTWPVLVIATMEQHQVRRVPVVDELGRCVGMISQADLAWTSGKRDLADLVREISRDTGSMPD